MVVALSLKKAILELVPKKLDIELEKLHFIYRAAVEKKHITERESKHTNKYEKKSKHKQ